MVSEQIVYALSWASWSSIFAGGVTAIAISIIMAILGVGLGFTVVNPKSDDPAAGLGMVFGGWSFLSIVVSMACGGFIAGLLSGQRGLEHGFLTWAITLMAATFFSSVAVGSAVKMIGGMAKSVGSGVASVTSAVSKGAVNTASNVVDELRDNINLNVEFDKLDDKFRQVLRDTGVDTLQPDYLQQQMREARSDMRTSLHQLALTPANYERIISGFLDKQNSRLGSLTKDVDKDAAVKALMKARNIPQEEAETMINNAITAYEKIVDKAKESLSEAESQVKDVKKQLKDMADQAREKADRFASMAAKTAMAASAALVLAAVISMGAGFWGAQYSPGWYTSQTAFLVR